MDSKRREEQIKHAREHFKNFHAEFKYYGDLQTLDWKDKSGSNYYHVHYIFDTKQKYMHVSGDLGAACFFLTWEPNLRNMSNMINNPQYIIGKMECATDKFVYPEDTVRADIEEYYADCRPERKFYEDEQEYEEALKEYNEFINDFIEAHDYHNGFCSDNYDIVKKIEKFDPEWYEHDFGRCISTRVYCWLVGLQMAWEQVKAIC